MRRALPDPGSGSHLWHHRHMPNARRGHPGQAYGTGLALAVWLCRATDRIDPARVCRSFDRLEAHLRRILRTYARYYNDIRTHRSLTKMRRYRAQFSELERSYARSLADFITNISGLVFGTHNAERSAIPSANQCR